MGVREPKSTVGKASGARAGNLRGLHSNFLYLPLRDSDLVISARYRLD